MRENSFRPFLLSSPQNTCFWIRNITLLNVRMFQFPARIQVNRSHFIFSNNEYFLGALHPLCDAKIAVDLTSSLHPSFVPRERLSPFRLLLRNTATRWLIKCTSFFLTVLEARNMRSECPHGWGRAFSELQTSRCILTRPKG